MAGTYYKYAEREADSYVNWAEIGKNMSDMLANENKVREQKKAAIDQASREFGEILSNAPQGESKLMNEWALKFGGDAQSARLMQDKLLKSGQLKLNDYLIMRQNVTDGTTNAFKLSTEYQEEFKTKWDRMKEDKSQDLEQFLMAEAEGFGNFTQTQLYINPTDGKVSVAYKEKGEDGVYRMSDNPSKFTDINSLRNRIKGQFDKYDVNTNMESFVAGLGTQIDSLQVVKATLGSTGLISETLDIMQREAFPIDPVKVKELYSKAIAGGYKGTQQQWVQDQKSLKEITTNFFEFETKALQSQLANPYNAASILTNSLDICPSNKKPYTYTWDPKDAEENPEKILLTNKSDGSPLPKFSEQQEADALQYLRTDARSRYDKKEELKVIGQTERRDPPNRTPITSVEKDIKDENDLALNFSRQTSYLMSGTDEQKAAAVAYFRGKGADIDSRADGIYLANERGEMVVFKNKGNTTSVASSIVGPLLSATKTNLSDTKVTKYFPKFIGQTFNTTAAGKGTVEVETEDFSGQMKNYTDKNTRINIITDAPKETALKLGASYNKLGFKFEGKTTGMFNQNDFIKITAPNGTVSELIPVDNKDNVDIINQFIIDNRSDEKAKSVFKSSKAPR